MDKRLAVYIGFNLEHFAFGEGLGAGIEDDDEGALMGFAGSMRANCCPFLSSGSRVPG